MVARLEKTVVLVGLMGAGKSAVGAALAQRLGVPFKDTDAEIELAANATIPEIFASHGEPFFREKESRVLERLLSTAPMVLSTGGGVFLSPRNREAVAIGGVSVWLRADLALLWSRVKDRQSRPLLNTADPYAALSRLWHERAPAYGLSDLVVDAEPGLSVDGMAAKVAGVLSRDGSAFGERSPA